MRKLFLFFFTVILILSCGCSKSDVPAHNPADYKRTFNVTEEYYLQLITDILNNPVDYLENNINIEGMFKKENDKSYVYRNGPDCCYPEGVICGLEFEGNTDSLSENDWIKVSGTISYYETNDGYSLILKNCTIEKKETRGLETLSHEHDQDNTNE